MSPICQTFVQNTWKKDLCSNCFKSRVEHDYSRTSSLERSSQAPAYSDIGSLPRRYVGVAGRSLYNRNYYGKSSSWSSDKESNLLKSPSLIKGMDDIIKQENERNKQFQDMKIEPQKDEEIIPPPRHSYPFRDSWLYSNMTQDLKSKTEEHKIKDSSSDLGSDASSHDTSASSSMESACSDTSSGRCSTELKEQDLDSSYEKAEEEDLKYPGILKLPSQQKECSGNRITFNKDEIVIGYGGDVDYSDDEEDFSDDDDDLSISSMDLNPQERLMKRITEKNTEFNSESRNLETDNTFDKEDLGTNVDDFSDTEDQIISNKTNESKVKLRRSQQHVTTKPPLKQSSSNEESSCVDSFSNIEDEQPMKGIKPKYVSQDQEMQERREDEPARSSKITSIDDVCSAKVTSIDDILFDTKDESDVVVPEETTEQPVKVEGGECSTLPSPKSEKQDLSSSHPSNISSLTNIQRRSSFMESQLGVTTSKESTNQKQATKSDNHIGEERESQTQIAKISDPVEPPIVQPHQTPISSRNGQSDPEASQSESIPKKKVSPQASLTTFGTPVQQKTETSLINDGKTSLNFPEEHLTSQIKLPDTVHTAGIQKGVIYTSTSSLKGIPLPKPHVNPKPGHLKDKPKLPPKKVMKSSVPKIPTSPSISDVIYAVPVIKTPVVATSPTSSSSGYSSTSTLSPEKVAPDHEDQSRKSFEANRIALQSALNLKRQAPSPPETTDEAVLPPSEEPKETIVPADIPSSTVSAVHLAPHLQDNQDFDSYSSFTDDFDDEEDVQPPKPVVNAKKSERSSSAAPTFRNSMGSFDYDGASGYGMPISFDPVNVDKKGAVRSLSVPRSVESSVHGKNKKKQESSSRFGFKTSFFRPSSPPSKRKFSSERGRDTTKKPSSGFSLRKLLRIGSSSSKNIKTPKTQEDPSKENTRETRKQQLKIIHPLDYNASGVEVIARPEKTSPIYDYTGVYSPTVQPNLPETEEILEHKPMPTTEAKLTKDTSSTSSVEKIGTISMVRTNSSGSERSIKNPAEEGRQKAEKKSSFLRKKRKPQRNDSEKLPPTGLSEKHSQAKLGYNSEGRPKPPPPPRKTSLECSSDSSIGCSDSKADQTSQRGSSGPDKRPHRPPPPRRSSNASRLAALKPSLYANLGDVRAPLIPRKPLRSASIKEDEKEKRPAPQPPLHGTRHSSYELLIIGKPLKSRVASTSHDYEYINESDRISQNEGSSENSSGPSSVYEKTANQNNSRTTSLPNLSLEAQYGAVVLSNLEALTNLLDQISSRQESDSYPKALKQITSWKDFNLSLNDPVCCGVRLFYDATLGSQKLTVMLTPENKVEVDPLFMPSPAVSLKHEVSSNLLSMRKEVAEPCLINASIWVLPPMTLTTLEEFSTISGRLLERNPSEWERRISLLLLQFVTALKQLQARGTEDISLDQILVADMEDSTPRLVLIPSIDEESFDAGMSLCSSAVAVTFLLLGYSSPKSSAMKGPVLSPPFTPRPHAFSALVNVLREERASSLTKAKCILETMLYGPLNFKPSTEPNLDQSLQNWLDLERASVLQSSLGQYSSNTKEIPLMFKFQLIFLVRTNLKSLKEVIKMLEAPDVTNF